MSNPIIEQCVLNGANVVLRINENKEVSFVLDGFYKYGQVEMTICKEDSDVLICKIRYDIVKEFLDWEGFVNWNHSVWLDYRNSFSGWENPEPVFLGSMLELGLIKKEVKTTFN